MAITGHVTTRVYGQVFGTPPFQNASGQAAFSDTNDYPAPPLTGVNLVGANIWPLANGVQVGGSYVYAVIELPPSGLNVHGVKLATFDSATTLIANAT
jgi:hypothetical protein